MIKIFDLNFTEWWYLGKPVELAEYRRLKKIQRVDDKALDVVSAVRRKSCFKQSKRGRKREKKTGKKRKFK